MDVIGDVLVDQSLSFMHRGKMVFSPVLLKRLAARFQPSAAPAHFSVTTDICKVTNKISVIRFGLGRMEVIDIYSIINTSRDSI